MTAKERKTLIKNLLDRAVTGEMDAGAVLIDVIHDEHPDLAEDLSLALQGRTVLADVYSGVLYQRGDPLPAYLRVASISHVVGRIRRAIFPKRRAPSAPKAIVDQYIFDHVFETRGGRYLVPDRYETPPRIVMTMIRRYGSPQTIDRGEVSYWEIPASEAAQILTERSGGDF